MNTHELLLNNKNIAVIGVTSDKDKYGYKIFKALLHHNYNVYGISNKYSTIDNHKLYKSLTDIHQPIDIVVFVINKQYAYSYIDEMKQLNIKIAWMQPHTYDEQLLSYMKDLIVVKDCILIQLNHL